jgi:hypothetical protein
LQNWEKSKKLAKRFQGVFQKKKRKKLGEPFAAHIVSLQRFSILRPFRGPRHAAPLSVRAGFTRLCRWKPDGAASRRRLHHGEYSTARQMLERIIAKEPRRLSAREWRWATWLLREGRDLAAAEQALHAALAIAPQHAEARKNLDILLREKERKES